MSAVPAAEAINHPAYKRFSECLALQRNAYRADPAPSLAQRRADLTRLSQLIKENEAAVNTLVKALQQQAVDYLLKYKDIASTDPYWYESMEHRAIEQSWDADRFFDA